MTAQRSKPKYATTVRAARTNSGIMNDSVLATILVDGIKT